MARGNRGKEMVTGRTGCERKKSEGSEMQLGGDADMDNDVFIEVEEEETPPTPKKEPKSWSLLARYMANFKPNTVSMFDHFADDVWKLRAGIEYSERGKNYYMITLFSRGDYDFVRRGGPWIFNMNVLLVKELDDAIRPSEMVLDKVPIWVRVYDVPWGKQNWETGMKFGNSLGKAVEVDVPKSEQEKNEFIRVPVELPYNRRLQTQIVT
jgi:hypothetical protein